MEAALFRLLNLARPSRARIVLAARGVAFAAVLAAATIPAGAASEQRARLFVGCQDAGKIAVTDLPNIDEFRLLEVSAGPANVVYAAGLDRIISVHSEAGLLTFIDPGTLEIEQKVDVGGNPFGLAVDAQGRLFVGDWNGDVVRVFAASSFELVKEIPVGKSPAHVVFLPIAQRVVVANRESGSVSFIDPEKLEVVLELPSGEGPFAIGRAANDDLIAVANVRDGTVTLIQPEPPSLYEKIRTGKLPYGAAFTPGTREVFVVNQQSGNVRMVTTHPINDKGRIEVGRYPEGIVMTEDGASAYVTNWMSGDVSVIDVEARKETRRVKVCDGPRALVIVPADQSRAAAATTRRIGDEK